MKPYRLINASEMRDLEHYFQHIISHWNKEYCVTPLSVRLGLPSKNDTTTQAVLIQCQEHPIAWLDGDYLRVMKQALFNHMNPCFNAASQELTLRLIHTLCQTQACHINPSPQEKPHWFYGGSTCLSLTLACEEHHYTLSLNPEWVYQKLSPQKSRSQELHSLDDALAEHRLSLNLELIACNLSVKTLTEMQIGDVLLTDHPLSMPLRLIHEKQGVAQAELGQSSAHKSILLKRSL